LKLSILVLAYNKERFIEQAMSSIFSQVVNFEYEIVIAEDCSTDRTKKIIQSLYEGHPNVRVIYNEENLSLSQPFRAMPRDHDMVVLKDIFYKHENPKMILKLAYLTLANTANVIIMEKKGIMDIDATKALLEEFMKDAGLSIEDKSIIAPMPGLVIKILTKVGDEVKKGDKLVIIEAMKMENSLASPINGIVTKINAVENNPVEKDTILIELEESK